MLYDQIHESVDFIKSQADFSPQFGIILGTGLGRLADEIETVAVIPYKNIPHFPVSTVQSHRGELILGYLDGIKVVAMAGRFHYYEGYSMKQVTFPVRVLKQLEIKRLVISNAAGSVHPDYNAGDIVVIRDHINLLPDNPLRGENDERMGPRFPDMLHAYDKKVNLKALETAEKLGFHIHEGVYVGVPGPNLETPAEYNFFNKIGGDVVGMSTVPEVIVARHIDLPVFVLSVVSNKCFPLDAIRETTAEEVIAIAQKSEPRMSLLVREMLKEFAK